jgi:hypothetical protein
VATAAKLLVDQEERKKWADRQNAEARRLSEQKLRQEAEDRRAQEARDRALRGVVLMVLIAVLGVICLGVAAWCGGSACW